MDQIAGLRMFGSDNIKLDRMDGTNFTRWKEKMKFLLTTFKNNKGNDKKRKGTWNSSKDNKKDKKPLSEVVCYKCGDKGHIKRYCKNPKKKNQNTNKNEFANAVDQVDTTEIVAMVSERNIGMIQELHMARKKNNKGNDKKRKGTWNSSKDNKKDKKPLSEVMCYKCGDKGHIKRYCKNPKKKNQNTNKNEFANAVEQVDTTEIAAIDSEMNIGMIQELHMASVITTYDWWYDSGATTHVCNNKDLFKTYKESEDGHEVMMGDSHASKVAAHRYATSLSKFKAASYLLDNLEEQMKGLHSSSVSKYNVEAAMGILHWPEMRRWFYKWKLTFKSKGKPYTNHRILGITDIPETEKRYGYNFLDKIVVRRSDDKEYSFSEADYHRLNPNDIEDLYVLKVQGKVQNLPGSLQYDLINSLLIFARQRIIRVQGKAQNLPGSLQYDLINSLLIFARQRIIWVRDEDAQLGVESYQISLNFTAPQTTFI
ncbi:hypothetical protein CTI12_AA475510 [Artemisia annua]|uniref:CCHC-type domain-containing protein n=1 Tax=Artemisia annua TaxID=35608 RepID=A0A2U1LF82_ARTAN|nr:hypothetical protein CTI12_AA475510 [Artemisia annua]